MRLSKDNLNNSIFDSFTNLSIFLVADLMSELLSSRVPRNCNINIMHMIRIVYKYNWKSNDLLKDQKFTMCMCVPCTFRWPKVAICSIVSKASNRTNIESSFSTSINKFNASPANSAEMMVSARKEWQADFLTFRFSTNNSITK